MAAPTISTETLKTRLEEAREAYHKLQIGESARVVVDQNGERVEYTAANSNKLAAYIAELERQLNGSSGRKGPMNVWF